MLFEMAHSFVPIFLSVVFCVASGNNNELNDFLFKRNSFEFIDLSYPYDKNTVNWPNSQKFAFTKQIGQITQDGSWYAANDFQTGEHVGTHLDAPYHFKEYGLHVGELPLEKLIVPLIIVDVSKLVNNNPNFVLHKHNLDYMLNDNFGKPCVIIFKFGWSKYFYDRQKYLGENATTGVLNFPGLSGEVGEWIVKSYKNVVGIGVDVASVDPGSSTNLLVHKVTADNGLYLIENVNLDRDIPDYGCTALVLPMKLALGSGAPLRLVAICPKKIPENFN